MDVVLIGSGGCMREIAWQMLEPSQGNSKWNIIGYVDLNPSDNVVYVCNKEIPYLGNDDYFDTLSNSVNVAVTVGESKLRKKIVDKLMKKKNILFPNIILNNAHICSDVKMGIGCVICERVKISTNVKVGDFVFFNIGSIVCHDDILEDYVTLSPSVNLSGNVKIGACTNIGVGSTVIPDVKVGKHTIIGAGSVIINDIPPYSTAVGVPARVIKSREI